MQRPTASTIAAALLSLSTAACSGGGKTAEGPVDSGTKTSTTAKRGELPEATFGDGPIARVNGVEVTRKQFDTYYNRFRISMHKNPILFPVGGAEAVMSRVAKRLIVEEIIRQQAKTAGVTVPDDLMKARMEEIQDRLKRDPQYAEYHRELGTTDEVWRAEAEVDLLRELLVEKALKGSLEVPQAELQAAYEAQIEQFKHPEQVKLSRIRFDIASGMTGDQIKVLRDQANKVRDAIKKGLTFEKAAKEFSQGASKDKGGELGWVGRLALPEPISLVLWKMKPNQVSDVLEDERGFYIYKVIAFRKEGVKPLEEVRPVLLIDLKRTRQEAAVAKLMEEWRNASEIEVLVPVLSDAMTRTATAIPPIPEAPPTDMPKPALQHKQHL